MPAVGDQQQVAAAILEADPARALQLQRAGGRAAALASVWTKLAVIVWTEEMCASSLAMSALADCAAAGAAAATIATGSSARAREIEKLISKLLGILRRKLAFPF